MSACAPDARPRLSIGIITRALPVHRLGGLEHHVRDLAAGFAARGHRVSLITTRGGGADPLGQTDGITIHEIVGTDPGDYSVTFFRQAGRIAAELACSNPLDVLIPIDMAGMFIEPRRFPVPVIPWIHGTMTSEVSLDHRYFPHLTLMEKLGALWQYKSRLALWYPFRRMIRRNSTVIVDSEFTRNELLRQSASSSGRIHVVPLGIDTDRYPGPLPSSAPPGSAPLRIALIGRMQRHKGLSTALQAARQLRDRAVSFHMTLGGSGEYLPAARQFIQQHNLHDHVSAPGRIPPEELASYFSAHNLFLFPDWTQPAFGLVALEAMHYRLPIIAARVGAVPEVVTPEVGWLYPPRDATALADLIQRISRQPDMLQQKVEAASVRLSQFTLPAMIQRAEDVVYNHLMENPR